MYIQVVSLVENNKFNSAEYRLAYIYVELILRQKLSLVKAENKLVKQTHTHMLYWQLQLVKTHNFFVFFLN